MLQSTREIEGSGLADGTGGSESSLSLKPPNRSVPFRPLTTTKGTTIAIPTTIKKPLIAAILRDAGLLSSLLFLETGLGLPSTTVALMLD
jgi:hypothetical protein